MNEQDKTEVVNQDVEVLETCKQAPDQGLTKAKVATIIDLADQLDSYGKAMDKVMRFVLSRALEGDFVKFGSEQDGYTIELTGAAAERIARDVGISFVNWREPKRISGTDALGAFYTWEYVCDTVWGARSIERVEGRAGSRDQFFGKVRGQWKPLEEVKESDIKSAARHKCMSEGVKNLLGLRRIPAEAAERLGLAASKIKAVKFGEGGNKDRETKEPANDVPQTIVTTIRNVKAEKRGKFTIHSVHCDDGRQYDTFDEKLAKKAEGLGAGGEKVAVSFTIHERYGRQLKAIEKATVEQIQAAAKPASAPAETPPPQEPPAEGGERDEHGNHKW